MNGVRTVLTQLLELLDDVVRPETHQDSEVA